MRMVTATRIAVKPWDFRVEDQSFRRFVRRAFEVPGCI